MMPIGHVPLRLCPVHEQETLCDCHEDDFPGLARIIAQARAEERAACARVAEEYMRTQDDQHGYMPPVIQSTAAIIARMIRERGPLRAMVRR